MAVLAKKNDVFLARFRFEGKEFKRSLKTMDQDHARAALRRIEDVLHWLAIKHIVVPENVDAGDFIVSGGVCKESSAEPRPANPPTVERATEEYLNNLGHVAESHRYTIGVHLRNLKKVLPEKATLPVDQLTRRDLEAFLQARLRERASTTVRKERDTIVNFFKWIVGQGYILESPAAGLPTIKASGDQSPFRTTREIEQIIQRGGLSEDDALALWDCVYLTLEEIAALLDLVKKRSTADVSFLLHAIPAYTGMRRGEVLRLRWVDLDFDHGSLIARSKKQSRQAVETHRRIEMHEELRLIMQDWRGKRPRGQFVICDDGELDPLTPSLAAASQHGLVPEKLEELV